MPYRNFAVVSNASKDPDFAFAKEVIAYLKAAGAETKSGAGHEISYDDVDCVLVLGGDGTVLRAVRDLAGRPVPIFGINLGTLGYLSEVERQDWKAALDQLLSGSCFLESRMLLEAEDKNHETLRALNDVVISRAGSIRLLTFSVYVADQLLGTFSADGVIVATPTGSTAYNLSAGGPIVEPSGEMILLTPICAHTTGLRSIVLSADKPVRIRIGEEKDKEKGIARAEASFDGDRTIPIEEGESIEIRRSLHTAVLCKLKERSFLETLHRKLV